MENAELIDGLVAQREEASQEIERLKREVLAVRADLYQIEKAIAVWIHR